jgi:CBS domain-containing protein
MTAITALFARPRHESAGSLVLSIMSTNSLLPGRQTVGQVMRPPTTIEPEAHLAAAAYLIEHSHDPALVVTTDDTHEPVAMITDAEVTRAVAHGRNLEETRISQVVTTKPVTVQADVDAEDAARLMLSQGVKHLPVVEGRRLVGMVELADLYRVSLAPGPFSAAAGTS